MNVSFKWKGLSVIEGYLVIFVGTEFNVIEESPSEQLFAHLGEEELRVILKFYSYAIPSMNG